jgi:penicillin G amidase
MDSIAIWKWRWWMLTGRLAGFAVEEAAKRFLPPELWALFFSSEAGEETIVPGDEPAWRGGDDTGEGSNNWVVGGSRTVNGKPILASDPHNEVSLARQWYQAQVTAPGMDAIGAFFLGTPGIYLGHNRCTAWGVTNHGASVRDLYVEKTLPADPDQYRDGEHWRPFEEDRQEVAVRGRPAEMLVVRRTVRGPLVNEFVPGLESASPLSMRWRGAEPTTGFEAMLGLMRSRNVAQIETALAQWPMPILNFVYADVEGAIGYHAAGQVPRRQVQAIGVRPADDPEHAWSSPYPFDELPKLRAPQRDWVATANNAPWGGDRPYLRSGSWADGYRFRRIRESIEQTDRHTLASVAAIQADIVHARARELAPRVAEIALAARQRQLRRLGELLREWNGAYTVESVAATVFAVFWELWMRRVARARFPASAVPLVAGRTGSIACWMLLSGDGGEWFPEKVDIPSEVRRTLVETLSWLREHVGRQTSQWRWGRLHTVTFRHPLSDGGPRSELFDVGPFAASGGSGTVRATGYSFAAPFAVTGLSTYRLVVDLADPAHALATSAGGQSGHPSSPHYRTQSELWVADHYHPLLMDRQEVEANLLD